MLKIILDIQEDLIEDEVHIRCKELNRDILDIEKQLQGIVSKKKEILVYREEKEYYISLQQVLFFETSGRDIVLQKL